MNIKETSILCLILLLMTPMVFSKEYCITNSNQLQQAFEDASNDLSSVSFHFKIAEGYYAAPSGGFVYKVYATNIWADIKISGGWSGFFGNPCGQQFYNMPFKTVLDGKKLTRIMTLQTGDGANIDVSNLSFFNGYLSSREELGGAGLLFRNHYHIGEIRVFNTLFYNNVAAQAAALYMPASGRAEITNSIFSNNYSSIDANVILKQDDEHGIYFINNTAVNNESFELWDIPSGVHIEVSGESQALVANNLLWDNLSDDLWLTGNGFSYVMNNDYQSVIGSVGFSANNISQAPVFDPNAIWFSYLPAANSPVVNQGLNPISVISNNTPFHEKWRLNSTDVVGQTRILNGTVDVGASEYWAVEDN